MRKQGRKPKSKMKCTQDKWFVQTGNHWD